VIRLENLHVRVGNFDLRDISFEVPKGGYALIIGPTGSGKTTLLEAVAGHARLRSGRVFMHEDDVTTLPPEQRGLGFVYQQYHLFPHLTVRENVAYGVSRGRAGLDPNTRVAELAQMLAIEPLLERPVRGLSGGEQQRVALARALAPKPSILLLDEPFAAVDPATRQVLRRELRDLHDREGITTLQVTHDFDEALRLGDLVAVLSEGRIAQSGTPEEVFRYPNSAFIARFVGTGNVIAGTVRRADESNGRGPFRAQFTGGNLVLDVVAEREGPMHAVIRPEDIVLSLTPHPASARNHINGRVVRLERIGPVTLVHLDVGRPLIASLTTQSVQEMGLTNGLDVIVAFKATAILLV
jgi:molybdate/tungstate transport system ATP-binding protein